MAVVQPSNNQYLALPFPLFLKTYPFIRQKRLFCTAKPMPLWQQLINENEEISKLV